MEERIWTGLLLDFYGGLLTEHQRSTLELYLMEDLSLGEIGEQLGITRQGVRDAIVRGEAALRKAEENAGIVARYQMCIRDSADPGQRRGAFGGEGQALHPG